MTTTANIGTIVGTTAVTTAPIDGIAADLHRPVVSASADFARNEARRHTPAGFAFSENKHRGAQSSFTSSALPA